MRMILAAIAASACLACSPPVPDSAAEPAEQPAAATRGLDPALMAQAVAAASRLPRLRTMIVMRNGQTLAEHRFNGAPALDVAVNIKSASKTVLSALAGIAIDKGVLSGPDQRVADILSGDLPANPDPRLRDLTLGNLLSMQAGLDRTSGENYGAWVSSPNWVRYALSRDFVDRPGGRMLYSTGSSHLVSAMLTRASGRSTHALAQDWLADPLGIRIPQWPRDPQGVYFGGNDMLMSPRALARFGELYRNGGMANGRRVVSARWIAESWQPRTRSPWSGNDYGYGWFTKTSNGHAVRFAWGYGGQMLFVVPDLGLTVVMTSDVTPRPRAESHLPDIHAILDRAVVPAATRGG